MLFNNKLFNSIACLLSFTNLQLVIPGRTWILLYLGRTVYKRLWACLALYQQNSTTSVQKYVSEVPPHPWHMLGSDLFYFQRIDFLVVVDYFSKYLIVRKIPSSTSSAVIKELGMILLRIWKPTSLQK